MTDRDGLVALVESYAKRTDLTTQIVEEFLPIAEARIGRDLQSRENETLQEFLAQATNDFAVPDDYGRVRAFEVAQSRGPITLKSVDLHTINHHDQSGQPRVYTIRGNTIEVRPFRESDFTMFHWRRPKLDAPDATDPVLDVWPQLYLYAVLLELHLWERDTIRAQQSDLVYADEVLKINRDAGRAAGDKPAMRRA